MKLEQIREMESAAISEEIISQERALMDLRMGNAIGTVDNPLEIRFARKSIARMKTVLRERELSEK